MDFSWTMHERGVIRTSRESPRFSCHGGKMSGDGIERKEKRKETHLRVFASNAAGMWCILPSFTSTTSKRTFTPKSFFSAM